MIIESCNLLAYSFHFLIAVIDLTLQLCLRCGGDSMFIQLCLDLDNFVICVFCCSLLHKCLKMSGRYEPAAFVPWSLWQTIMFVYVQKCVYNCVCTCASVCMYCVHICV